MSFSIDAFRRTYAVAAETMGGTPRIGGKASGDLARELTQLSPEQFRTLSHALFLAKPRGLTKSPEFLGSTQAASAFHLVADLNSSTVISRLPEIIAELEAAGWPPSSSADLGFSQADLERAASELIAAGGRSGPLKLALAGTLVRVGTGNLRRIAAELCKIDKIDSPTLDGSALYHACVKLIDRLSERSGLAVLAPTVAAVVTVPAPMGEVSIFEPKVLSSALDTAERELGSAEARVTGPTQVAIRQKLKLLDEKEFAALTLELFKKGYCSSPEYIGSPGERAGALVDDLLISLAVPRLRETVASLDAAGWPDAGPNPLGFSRDRLANLVEAGGPAPSSAQLTAIREELLKLGRETIAQIVAEMTRDDVITAGEYSSKSVTLLARALLDDLASLKKLPALIEYVDALKLGWN